MWLRRKKANKPVKPGKVHLVFGRHEKQDPLLISPHELSSADIVVLENSEGKERHEVSKYLHSLFHSSDLPDFYKKFLEFKLRQKSVVPVYFAESSTDPELIEKLKQLNNRHKKLRDAFLHNPTFKNYQRQLAADVKVDVFREQLIEQTISDFSSRGKNVLARFGSAHSTISGALRKKFEVSRKIFEEHFLYSPRIIRKKVLGRKVKKTELELAYIEECFDYALREYCKKHGLSNRQIGFLFSALLNQFENPNSRRKLIETINYALEKTSSKNPERFWAVLANQNLFESLILVPNGLLRFSSKKEVLQWLEKHNLQWRRLRAAKRYRNQ